jgi:hypothetical protein
MLSITFFHNGDAIEAWENIGKYCNRMLTYARKYSGNFNYVRVVEPHADGEWPHIHLVVDKPIDDVRFVKKITDWGFGWNFHSKPMTGIGAARYVSKYLTKDWPSGNADLYRVMTKTRIVTSSRSLGPIFKTHSSWRLVTFDHPKEQLEFIQAAMISELRKNGATYVSMSPLLSGFTCESEVRCSSDFIDKCLEPWIWKYGSDGKYDYLPYGVQEELPF